MQTNAVRSFISVVCQIVAVMLLVSACQRQADDRASGSSGSTGSSGASTAGRIQNSDSMITAKVKAALTRNRLVNSIEIHVDTDQGEVTLSGMADSAEQIDQAVKNAEKIEGVRKISNKMTIKKS